MMQAEASQLPVEGYRRKKPGQHLLRHELTVEVAAAAAHCLGSDREQAGVAVVQLRQPELRHTFTRVFGVHTSSGNNDWMRGKLLQALGLNARWRPAAVSEHESPTASEEGSPDGASLRHSARARRPPAALQLDSASSMEQAEAFGAKRRHKAFKSGGESAAKRARQSPEAQAPSCFCGKPVDRPATCHSRQPVMVVPAGLPLMAPASASYAAPAPALAALSSPFRCADSSQGLWPQSPGTLSRQQSQQLPPMHQQLLPGMPAREVPRAPSPQQAAMAALQALGLPATTAQLITSHPRVADAMLRQRFGQAPPQAWQAAPPCYPCATEQSGFSDSLQQQQCSAASLAAARAAHAAQAAQAATAKWGMGWQAGGKPTLLPLQSAAQRPSFAFWGSASPPPLATPAQQQAPATTAWSFFALAGPSYGPTLSSAAHTPALQLQPEQPMRHSLAPAHTAPASMQLPGPDPAAMPPPFAGYWSSASAPATAPGSPGASAALPLLHCAPSGPGPSPFAAYAGVPLHQPVEAPLPSQQAQQAQRFTADPALLALAGLGEGDLPSSVLADTSSEDDDLQTLFLAWQEQDDASLALPN